MPGSSATASTSPPLTDTRAEFMNGSAATFRPTCFMDTSARRPASDTPSASFVRRLLVRAPGGVRRPVSGGVSQEEFQDFGRRGAGVAVCGVTPAWMAPSATASSPSNTGRSSVLLHQTHAVHPVPVISRAGGHEPARRHGALPGHRPAVGFSPQRVGRAEAHAPVSEAVTSRQATSRVMHTTLARGGPQVNPERRAAEGRVPARGTPRQKRGRQQRSGERNRP